MEIERPTPVVDEELDNLYYADELDEPRFPHKKVPTGDVFEASRAGDVERLKILLEQGVNVNARDSWDSVALYYACLTGHLDAARMLLESGAICSEHTFDGDRCHYAALNLRVRKLLKAFEARPPPLEPLQKSLRELFLSSQINSSYVEGVNGSHSDGDQSGANTPSFSVADGFNPDVTFFVRGQPIEVHRAILIARSPFFKNKFERGWKHRKEVRFANVMLTYPALFSLIHFFYTDRLDVAVDDMEDLVRVCKVCGCVALERTLEKELVHQKYAEHKHLRGADDSQKRFILQGLSLLQEERLPAALEKLLSLSLSNSKKGFRVKGIRHGFHASQGSDASEDGGCSLNSSPIGNVLVRSEDNLEVALDALSLSEHDEVLEDDHADVCFLVEGKLFRSHQVILAARSEYFRARFCRTNAFCNRDVSYIKTSKGALPVLSEQDLSAEVFEKILEYMYTDKIKELDPDQAEEIFDAGSRFLLFPLKRAVADALLPQLETASPTDLCQWLLIADMYGVWKLKEYCLDAMAANFDLFASTKEFGRMLRVLPPPSGDSCQRTTAPRAPGRQGDEAQGNLLDDLRDKWLEAEAAELDQRDESALQFDMRLEQLLLLASENDAP